MGESRLVWLACTVWLVGCSASSPGVVVDDGDGGAVTTEDAGPRPDAAPPEVWCGDYFCDEDQGESCETCPLDCGECPTCDLAPTCTGALAMPTELEPFEDCNNGERTLYSCGMEIGLPPRETNCTDPELRIRIREIEIRRDDLIRTGIYCVVTAEDGTHSELLISRRNEVGGGRSSWPIPLAESLFWGQGGLYRGVSNVTITYECYEGSNSAMYESLFDEVADQAADVAENGDGYGWVFGTVSVAAEIIGAALGSVSDKRILVVQQTIDAGALLEISNSRVWTIEHHDDSLWPRGYDLKLQIHSWGCATARDGLD